MNDSIEENRNFLFIKIIQSGEIEKIPLNQVHLDMKFNLLYLPLLKSLKISKENIILSNKEGVALTNKDLNLPVKKIVEKFGNIINLYYEKIF
ncbi:MAG: hypothetical protein ACTSQJ_11070 [Promethearchaeota archaeon]